MKYLKTVSLLVCIVFVTGLIALGCDKKDDTAKSGTTTTAPAPVSPEVASTGSNGSGTPGLPVEQIPAELKHDGFSYFGLQQQKPIEFEVTSTPGGSPETLVATTKLVSVDEKGAHFQTERTGGPVEMVGIEEVVLKRDGIYTTKLNNSPLTPPQLQVPADLAVGKTWSSQGNMELAGRKVQQKVQFRVAGFEKVTTKAGTFDAAKVVAQAQFQVDDKKSKSNIVGWYVKGLGTLKMVVTNEEPPKTITVEATKIP